MWAKFGVPTETLAHSDAHLALHCEILNAMSTFWHLASHFCWHSFAPTVGAEMAVGMAAGVP